MLILIKKYVLILILCFAGIIHTNIQGQIIIQTSPQIEEMVEMIIGEGVYYDNVTYQGADLARAIFEDGNTTNLGLDNGIVLCTGNPNFIPGPNDHCWMTAVFNTPPHPLLSAISTATGAEDAAVLEFDIVPETDTLRFRYVYGSEHYSQQASWAWSDVFGCLITGPDPAGGAYSNKNIAIVPGTEIVSIMASTIKNGSADCGFSPSGPCTNCEFYIDNIGGLTLQYDGFTAVLEAWVPVIPCQTYHILLGIQDGEEMGFLDSGVFIETSDYQSPKMQVTIEPYSSDTITLIEGCEEVDLIFKIPGADYAPVTAMLDYSGSTANPSAYPDGDFIEALPTEITFEEGEDSLSIFISLAKDGILEGDEILQIIVEYTLTCNPKYDTIEIIISDYIDMATQTSPDTMMCQGEEMELWVNVENGIPDYTYQWEGLPYINDTILVNPDTSTMYYVHITDMCQDTISDSIYVTVEDIPVVNLGTDTTICTGDELVLESQTGTYNNYLWSTGDTTSSITISDSGTYAVTVTNSCGEATDEIIIDQWPYPNPNIGPDLQLCYGETAFLEATFGFLTYTWQDNTTENFYSVSQSGLYYVNVEDIYGCTGSDTVLAFIGNIVHLEDTIALCEGNTATIHTNTGFDNYIWSNGQSGIDSIVVDEQGWYSVNVSYLFGCPSKDSSYVEATPVPEATISGEDLLCQGDTLLLVAPTGKYDYYWNDEPSVSNEYMITSGGNYILKMVNACGEDEATKTIAEYQLPTVDLGEDKLLFPGEEVTLNAGNFQSYTWNNDPNQTGQYITVAYEDINDQDSIWVEVFDGFCKNTDDIIIEVFSVDVPVVITPNGDGANDKFLPGEGWSGISKHHIMVFNRWGESIWESDNFTEGWDGKQNGSTVAEGTYFWVLEVWYGTDNIKKTYKGSLTVLGSGG